MHILSEKLAFSRAAARTKHAYNFQFFFVRILRAFFPWGRFITRLSLREYTNERI